MLTIPSCVLFALLAPYFASAADWSLPAEAPENIALVCDGVYSGGEPRGNAAFEALAALGIRTIVSVDGLAPDVERAQKHGLRYVHIPVGYDGIPHEAAAAIVAALQERPGPHYIHCHHGKHRGPALAAIAMRLQTGCDDAAVTRWLERAGVGAQYEGLWRDALGFRPSDVADMNVELHAVAPVSSLAAAMAQADRIWDRLLAVADAGWKPLREHPDVSPEHEALMLHEAFREMRRRSFEGFADDEFAEEMEAAETASGALLDALRASNSTAATASAELIRKSCNTCHRTWRN